MELSDRTYDGEDEGDRLVNGLGQLVDGQKGVDNFRSDVHGFGKGRPRILSSFETRFQVENGFIACFERESEEFHPAPRDN